MSRPRSREELAHDAVLLAQQGMSHRAIARSLRVSRNRVRELLEEHAKQRSAPHLALTAETSRPPRPSKLDGFREAAQQLLADFPDITAQRLFEELRGRGFRGGYTVVKKLVRKLRKPRVEISLPTKLYGPGEMSECDWSAYRVEFTHAPAQLLQAFCYVLTYSGRKYFRFYTRSDLFALMDGHVQAFTRFSGAAHTTKYDSQKAVVMRWEGRQPIYNPRFIDFATHYEFRPLACRPGHPNDKPRVERSFWELVQSFFKGRKFRDEADLHAQLEHWLATVCDLRRHRKKKRPRIEIFLEERPFLRPLPSHPYDTARVVYRLCDIEGFIAWEANRYSLPYEYVTDILPVRITQTELFVYAADLSLVARHELRPKGAGEEITLPGHRPVSKATGADLDLLRKAYEELGAASFLAGLEAHKPRSAAYHARHILALRERYATTDLVAALAHAQSFGAFEHDAIERVLRARAVPRRLDEYVAQATAEKLESLLGQSHTEPRDLREYDALPCWSARTQGDLPCPVAEPKSVVPPLTDPQPSRSENSAELRTSPPPANDSAPTSNGSD